MEVPKYSELMNPTFHALKKLGGSGSNSEIAETVIEMMQLPDEVVDEIHEGTQTTILKDRLGWARVYLKKFGVINNSTRGIWSINPEYADKEDIDPEKIVKKVRVRTPKPKTAEHKALDLPCKEETSEPWRDKLAQLLHDMNPYNFENLAMRVLR